MTASKKEMKKKEFINPVQYKIEDINVSRAENLLKNRLVRDIPSDFCDVNHLGDDLNFYNYFLLDNGMVLRQFKYEPGHNDLFESTDEVVKFLSDIKKEGLKYPVGGSTTEQFYAVPKNEFEILKNEAAQQLSEYLNMDINTLDYSINSIKKMDKKLEKLNSYHLDQIVGLLNIYTCRVVANEEKGEVVDVELKDNKFTMRVKKADKICFPIELIAKQMDDDEDGFSLSFVVDWCLNGHTYKIQSLPSRIVPSSNSGLPYSITPPSK